MERGDFVLAQGCKCVVLGTVATYQKMRPERPNHEVLVIVQDTISGEPGLFPVNEVKPCDKNTVPTHFAVG